MTTKEIEKKVDLHDTAIQLTNQKLELSMKTVTQGIEDLKNGLSDLKTSIDSGYVTKQQFENIRSDVEDLKSLKGWAIKIVVGAVIVGVLALLGLPKG